MADTSTPDTPTPDATVAPVPDPVFVTPQDVFPDAVPGGAYRLQDGSWVNAEGEPIKAPKGR